MLEVPVDSAISRGVHCGPPPWHLIFQVLLGYHAPVNIHLSNLSSFLKRFPIERPWTNIVHKRTGRIEGRAKLPVWSISKIWQQLKSLSACTFYRSGLTPASPGGISANIFSIQTWTPKEESWPRAHWQIPKGTFFCVLHFKNPQVIQITFPNLSLPPLQFINEETGAETSSLLFLV